MSKHILYADDNTDLQNLVKTAFERRGYRVTTVGDGWSCLHEVKRELPDLLILDIGMPKMDGLRTIEMLMSFDLKRDLPILLLTGNSSKEVVLKALTLGIADYLIKPFDLAELVKRVERQVQGLTFEVVRSLLQKECSPAASSRLAEIAEAAQGQWAGYLTTHEERELVLLLGKSVTPQAARLLPEAEARKVLRVYARRGMQWRCLWPRLC